MGTPFTLSSPLLAQPPALHIPGLPANYWPLTHEIVNNMQIQLTPVDHTVPMVKEPHVCVEGIVEKVIRETDGDHHIWLVFDGTTKDRIACEITPQHKIAPPSTGAHVRIYGIIRYDHMHSWWEIHPVDAIVPL